MSAIMMLRHLGEMGAASRIENALHRVYREGKSLTRDVGGKVSTSEFTAAVIGAFA
jgi:isocitrate dehydrogenase (NAD+)